MNSFSNEKKNKQKNNRLFICVDCGEITTNPLLRVLEPNYKRWMKLSNEELKFEMEETNNGWIEMVCPKCRKSGIFDINEVIDKIMDFSNINGFTNIREIIKTLEYNKPCD